MWLFTPFGFYSVVRDSTGKKLMVRARVREDLDRLRDVYLPSLSVTKATPERDYPFRAFVEPPKFGAALAQIGKDIDYRNFKAKVGVQLGDRRERLYEKVWDVMRKVKPERLVVAGIQPVGIEPTPAHWRRGPRVFRKKQTRAAVREGLGAKPLPARHTTLLLNRRVSESEMRRLRFGHVDRDWDDRWFAFMEGNKLFIHRTRTRRCIYVVHLQKRRDGMYIVSADVNADPKENPTRSELREVERLARTIERLLLSYRRPDLAKSQEQVALDWGWRPRPSLGPAMVGGGVAGSRQAK